MAQKHAVTAVIPMEETPTNEIRLSAFFDDDGKEILKIELDNKPLFRMDYDNLLEWAKEVKSLK